METYSSLLRGVARSVVDRVRGRDASRWTERMPYEEARELLEEAEDVRVTRLPVDIVPATTHRLDGEEAVNALTRIEETYTVEEPVLEVTCRGEGCRYELRTRYARDGRYGGEYRFRLDGDAW